jgi:serine/threonine-protein kinase PRP4
MSAVLGMPYDFGIDVWSIGCTLFELYTGKILFTGRSNNQMLRAIMECRGKFSHKILRKAQFAGFHFDDLLNFRSVEKDKLTGKVGVHNPIYFEVPGHIADYST